MNEDFLLSVEKIIQQRSEIDPAIYLENIRTLKELLIKKNKSAKNELNKTIQQYQTLKKSQSKEIEEISHDKEWIDYYLTCANYYQNINVSKTDLEIDQFHQEIAEKLKRQTRRLQKFQEYSTQLKTSYQNSNANQSAHREMQYREAEAILKKINFRIKIEEQRDYDSKIIAARNEQQKLAETLQTINQQSIQNISIEQELSKSNSQAEIEIAKIEEQIKIRANAISQSWDAIQKGNIELKNRLQIAKKQIESLRRNIKDIDFLLNRSNATLDIISQSENIVNNLFENIS